MADTEKQEFETEKATFGAGCFWGVEAAFKKVPGVIRTTVGYEGGNKDNPTYQEVCSDQTGHAEVVEVEYDPERVSYEKLLQVFFDLHDPTTPDRQGVDVGSQYRSVVFYHNPQQQRAAEKFKEALGQSDKFHAPVVTQIVSAKPFWAAEDYHQNYYEKQGIAH